MSKCSNQWILCLDADESLSVNLRKSLIQFFNDEELKKIMTGMFHRCSCFLGRWVRHGDWYPDRKLRLIKNHKAIWDGFNLHEKLLLTGNGKIYQMSGDLEHYSYPDIKSLTEKSLKYSDIFIENNLHKRKRTSLLLAVLRSLWRFFRCYFLKLGILDGRIGLIVALSIAMDTYIRHLRLWELKVRKALHCEYI